MEPTELGSHREPSHRCTQGLGTRSSAVLPSLSRIYRPLRNEKPDRSGSRTRTRCLPRSTPAAQPLPTVGWHAAALVDNVKQVLPVKTQTSIDQPVGPKAWPRPACLRASGSTICGTAAGVVPVAPSGGGLHPAPVRRHLSGCQPADAGRAVEHAGGRCATAGALAWGRDECRSVPSRARSHQARRQTMPPERSDTTRRETAG
jgi:hypothetical protein